MADALLSRISFTSHHCWLTVTESKLMLDNFPASDTKFMAVTLHGKEKEKEQTTSSQETSVPSTLLTSSHIIDSTAACTLRSIDKFKLYPLVSSPVTHKVP